ncbi:uncharacterized protein LTR77_004491 [Saxophila tyrrhenica]|uniref:CCZ1/INTU/HSP4 first Longin domain-containing protein n=1 Tax=Saxophila tyrrhenica TaxID=1690608 RepID=A0AAV9PCX6_9PEZI|nr:hypothetical protein LTR77_004491 [Saxophila tyrrhenica]
MSTIEWPSRVVPARLAFLAIYNPTLGPTDETFRDQLVYYYSRVANEARAAAKKQSRSEGVGSDALRQEENEKLRQIGLAQGMVDFAKSFSNGEPVDSIETDRSRIVLRELEKGWWILASIDLTQLPSIPPSDSAKKGGDSSDQQLTVEYSSREISPPALLVQQLLQAHSIFCLHHGPSLDDLFVRLSRDKFCNTLDRYWSRFSRSWDVLLHGNPAVDIFNGIKLASGGELGYGVGEEEWGSGEREVLEDLVRRTEGLEDVLVSRFGDPVSEDKEKADDEEAMPWMGNGTPPIASDGIVFSGIGALERHSIRDVSLWMRQIYSYGEYAYGVRDNPLRDRRKRRRRNPDPRRSSNGNAITPKPPSPERGDLKQAQDEQPLDSAEVQGEVEPGAVVDRRPEIHPRVASHDYATTPERTPTPADPSRPSVPPPIVTATERALENATRNADQSTSEREDDDEVAVQEPATTLGIPDQYMKYLTFGLSTFGKNSQKRPSTSRQSSASMQSKRPFSTKRKDNGKGQKEPEPEENAVMTQVDPIPDGETLRSKAAAQIRQENRGHFLIGLRGDLDASTEAEDVDFTDGSLNTDGAGSRIVLRTIQVELIKRPIDEPEDEAKATVPDVTTGIEAIMKYRRMRVLIYVHRPFIYCFLFRNRTSSLQWTEFYRSLHQILSPIRKALLSSTDVDKIAQRIESSHAATATDTPESDTASTTERNTLPSKGKSSAPIFDLIYDPRLLTVHTSIPNIPIPGTPAAEGILTMLRSDTSAPAEWTRLEALNVHSQILNTLQSVRSRKNDIERTSKTSRGWWVVWMKVPPSAPAIATTDAEDETGSQESVATLRSDQNIHIAGEEMKVETVPETQPDMHRIAFLVRKATDSGRVSKSTSSAGSNAMTSLFSNMSLGLGSRDRDPTGGASAGWGPAALAGGIGVDARRYVEGLLSLNR